jgi:hypothetical protein
MAKAYLSSDGDVATVLRTMFRSPEFWSQDIYRAKIKTPLEYVVSAARASSANFANMQPLVTALRDMGMPLFQCIPPTGYKWDAADWVSTGALVNRMNFALSLASNKLNGVTTTWSSQAAAASLDAAESALNLMTGVDPQSSSASPVPAVKVPLPTPESEEARLETLLVAGGISDSTRSAVLQQFEQQTALGAPGPASGTWDTKQPPSPGAGNRVPVAMKSNQQRNAQLNAPRPNSAPPNPPPIEKQDQVLAGLLLGSPEFQRR